MSSYTCLETYGVLWYWHRRGSSLQHPPHGEDVHTGRLEERVRAAPQLTGHLHPGSGLHCVLCHSSSITAEAVMESAEQRPTAYLHAWGLLSTIILVCIKLVDFTRWVSGVGFKQGWWQKNYNYKCVLFHIYDPFTSQFYFSTGNKHHVLDITTLGASGEAG